MKRILLRKIEVSCKVFQFTNSYEMSIVQTVQMTSSQFNNEGKNLIKYLLNKHNITYRNFQKEPKEVTELAFCLNLVLKNPQTF